MIHILLVDDQPAVRSGLRMRLALEPDLQVIAEAGDGRSALAIAAQLQPDVVLMDVSMPGMDGISATAALRARAPGCAVVILSLHGDASLRQQAQAAGAVAFVEKQQPEDMLLAAIRRAAAPQIGEPDDHE